MDAGAGLILSAPGEAGREAAARRFAAAFLAPGGAPRYVLGRNVYAASLARALPLAGVIDDAAPGGAWQGLPVVRADGVPRDALVINAAGGRPLTAKARLDALGLANLDYFAFLKVAGLPLAPVVFNEGFGEDYVAHADQYAWLAGRLADDESRRLLAQLASFRVKLDIELLRGLAQREHEQYFEDFLALAPAGEVFVDVGGFDGATSLEFIRRCPGYRAVHLFEPEPANLARCRAALAGHPNVHCHGLGLAAAPQDLRLEPQGSASRVAAEGTVDIRVARLDDVVDDAPTFIKIDTEGWEADALAGAAGTIAAHRPRLAVSVYHRAGDFWRIPRQVLAWRDDYRLYLRHYTESIYETVMFFV